MNVLIEYWKAALKLHTSRPSSFLFLPTGLMVVVPVFGVEDPIARAINALPAMFVLCLYIDTLRLVVHEQRDLRQKFIDSLDD